MASIYVKQCKHCKRVKKFQTWTPMEVELQYAINAGDITIMETICPDCIDGASNKLLPCGA